MRQHAVVGCLLGTAVGDAIGLPYEGVSRRRAAKLLGPPERHRFFFGRGMVSDDTEHACLVAQALIATAGEPTAFRSDLARRLRWWLLGLPAGVGRATLQGCARLWLGVPPDRSGVFSAGNGPAMRSPLLGVAIEDLGRMRELTIISARMTHSDPKAAQGALAVAVAARTAARTTPEDAPLGALFLETLTPLLEGKAGEEVAALAAQTVAAADAGRSVEAFAAELGLGRGVSGYVYHTVPVALHAWLSHPRDYGAAVRAVVACGGDTDTTAAIVGGIVGAAVGRAGIPAHWLHLFEWPRTAGWIETLGDRLSEVLEGGERRRPPRLAVVPLLGRNLVFLSIVLAHVARRCLPPY